MLSRYRVSSAPHTSIAYFYWDRTQHIINNYLLNPLTPTVVKRVKL